MSLLVTLDFIKDQLPDWPEWAMKLLFIMSGMLVVTYLISIRFTPDDEDLQSSTTNGMKTNLKDQEQLHKDFDKFRRKYISVYLIIMLADWMQGTHMYTLYLSYNVNISALFLTGFLSGAIFAPFLGSAVDKFGRKRSCIVYCLLEIVINVLEHYDDFTTLLVGRVLGGISTNLLFSAFESWMTTQHRHLGFPESWLQRTYSEASVGNGAMAIMAGIVAQLLEDQLGHIGPFQGAVGLTALALVLIMRWDENYGEISDGDHESSSLYQQFTSGWKATYNDSKIWRIGLAQALSEGAMYTFVFMWVPTLLNLKPVGGLPTGCVFSSFMIAITMGGMMFPVLQSFVKTFVTSGSKATEVTASMIYAMASMCMAIPAYCLLSTTYGAKTSCLGYPTMESILFSFVVVEFSVGLFNPVSGMLRSKYIPDDLQGSIMNIFRLPLNVVVVAGTYATDVLPYYQVYLIVSGSFMLAAILQSTMIFDAKKEVKIIGSKKKN